MVEGMEDIEGFLMEDASESLSGPGAAGLDPGLVGWWGFQLSEIDLVGISPNIEDDESLMLDPFLGSNITAASSEQNEEYYQFQGNDIGGSTEQNECPFQGIDENSSKQINENPIFSHASSKQNEHPIFNQQQQEEQRQCCRVEGSGEREEPLLEEEDDFFFNGNDDEEEEVESDDRKSSSSSSKNLISERNRRKRLNQQLFTLRSLVPNITKMDKRTILVDALAYLQGILQQTEALMKTYNFDSDTNIITVSEASDHQPVIHQDDPPAVELHDAQPQECIRPPIPTITQVDAEMIDADRFILKITCNRAIGALGQVQKVIESLGLEITLVSVYELGQDYSLTMAFLRAKKKGVVTVEKLKHRVKVLAKKMRFHLWGL